MDVIIIIIIPLFISLQWILCPLCSFFDSTTCFLSCCTRLLLFSKCGGSWEMLVHVCRLPLTGSSLWGPAVKFFFPSLFWIFFFSFQRQRLTQGPFRRFNSNKRFDFGYNSFDPHEFHLLPRTHLYILILHLFLNSLLPPFVTLLLSPDLVPQAGKKTRGSLGGR